LYLNSFCSDPVNILVSDWTVRYHLFRSGSAAKSADALPASTSRTGFAESFLSHPTTTRALSAFLDKLDALVNDLSVGLPAELAARRQQYEHYRDRLLTFEEAMS
jgi:type I restriction enzyme S subunit